MIYCIISIFMETEMSHSDEEESVWFKAIASLCSIFFLVYIFHFPVFSAVSYVYAKMTFSEVWKEQAIANLAADDEEFKKMRSAAYSCSVVNGMFSYGKVHQECRYVDFAVAAVEEMKLRRNIDDLKTRLIPKSEVAKPVEIFDTFSSTPTR